MNISIVKKQYGLWIQNAYIDIRYYLIQVEMASLTTDLNEDNRELRRSKLETHVDILRVIADGAEKPTHIMYKANLSWVALQVYLRSLMKRGLIVTKNVNGRKKYELTDQGFRVLNYFLRIRQALDVKEILVEQ